MKKDQAIILGIVVFSLIILSVFVQSGIISDKLRSGAIYSVSNIEEGSISNGEMVGGIYHFNAVLTKSSDDIILLMKDNSYDIGKYKVIPQKNVRLKIQSVDSYAEADAKSLKAPYYHGKMGDKKYITYVTNDEWRVYTPFKVTVYCDETNYPTTKYSEKIILLYGQQTERISNDVSIQQIDLSFLGPETLSDQVISVTSPNIPDIPDPSYRGGLTYIFDKDSFENQIDYFYEEYGGAYHKPAPWGYFSESYWVVWSGWDKGIIMGWRNFGEWDGIPYEVKAPSYHVSFNDDNNNKFRLHDIKFSSNVDVMIKTELVDSFVVLKGVGKPTNIEIDTSKNMIENEYYQIHVSVTNSGDYDGFNVVPSAKSGTIVFTPASFIGEEIESGETKTFAFRAAIAGTEKDYNESIIDEMTFQISANHNPDKIEVTEHVEVTYLSKEEKESSATELTEADTEEQIFDEGNAYSEREIVPFYKNIWFLLGSVLIIVAILLIYSDKLNLNKGRR